MPFLSKFGAIKESFEVFQLCFESRFYCQTLAISLSVVEPYLSFGLRLVLVM